MNTFRVDYLEVKKLGLIIIFVTFLFFIDSKKSSLVSYWWNINLKLYVILIKPNFSQQIVTLWLLHIATLNYAGDTS